MKTNVLFLSQEKWRIPEMAGAMKNTSRFQLTTEILNLSVAQNWDKARREWSLEEVYKTDEPETCLCGHFPIIELCILRNIRTGAQATVGNVCVNTFIGLPSDKIFQAIKRVQKDASKSLNFEAVEHAFNCCLS